MEIASDKLVVGPPGANISNGSGGVTAPDSKALTWVENIPGSRSGSWVQLMGPRRLLGEIGIDINV